MGGIREQVRVLLVEDDEDDYLITADALQLSARVRFLLDWQRSGASGLQAIKENRHDVYLIDYRLGDYTGLELIGEARQSGCSGPYILLTGVDDWDIDVRAMEAGAADYIVKGKFDTKLLERSIRYSMEQHKAKQELLRYAAEIDRKNHDLREAVRLSREATELKSQFLANVSHEIRTPMTSVIGMSQLLLETELEGEQREYAEAVHHSAHALMRVVDDILDMAKVEASNLDLHSTVFTPSDVVAEVAEMHAAWLREKNLAYAVNCAAELGGTYWGDARRIRQILLNLVNNAVKFTARGGVTVEAKVDLDAPPVTWVRFEVHDTGIGIDEQARGKIFDPFYQADGSTTRRHGGLGLGLAISRQLVDLLGGRMGFDTGPLGSSFWFTLPLRSCGPEGLPDAEALQVALSRPSRPGWLAPTAAST